MLNTTPAPGVYSWGGGADGEADGKREEPVSGMFIWAKLGCTRCLLPGTYVG